ncbi:hypothetical protein HanXRQr2_Chr07g0312761 [Helianthus annuus]|uniref:Uncharacterized protein n=1 Tax=Helianthus annuus TaxID=4232 RepID=A0A9K3ING3_HELAN|nr:hypothetical protein HanXRQr2_Chr07g0312761 [Helianthus annuus]KAJ0906188.1 hypothetical protein HanPSC8_Chr07g0302651 [Helianthus annuus]
MKHMKHLKKIRVNFKEALSFMFKIDEFCPLCFHIIHVLSFKPNPVSFFS